MKESNTVNEIQLPAVFQLPELSADAFVSYYRKRVAEIEKELLKNGAIKFKGINIPAVNTFQQIVDSISDKFLAYIDGNSPRTKLSGNVYTSTEFDKSQRITMHNELSYSAKWPNKIFFSCLQSPDSGGETLIADSREIVKTMDKSIVSAIEDKGIIYIRNLHGGQGMGPSWQETFETTDKQQLEQYCRSYQIAFEWGHNNSLRLKQFSRGIIRHRITKEKVWFNQIDQFHPIHLGEEMVESLKLIYDTSENFPMYVQFGDGSKIEETLVREILDTIDEITIAPSWEKNELLILDNELVCHGRNPYTGDRKVLVAMSE